MGLPDEYRAARDGAALLDFSSRERLRLMGPDRAEFLQGMTTQDVLKLSVGEATYTALLTPKGAMVSDARIVCLDDALDLDIETGTAGRVKDFLLSHVVSEEVEIEDATYSVRPIAILGPHAAQKLDEARQSGAVPKDGLVVPSAPWLPGGFVLWLPSGQFDPTREALQALGCVPASFDAVEVLRVEAGIPRYGKDMDEKTIPLEANLERAIDYQKGCYIGQEVIARATYRGHVNRRLVFLRLGKEPLPASIELWGDGKEIGRLTSVVYSFGLGEHAGLGMVHRDWAREGTTLVVAGRSVAVAKPPFA